MLYLRI